MVDNRGAKAHTKITLYIIHVIKLSPVINVCKRSEGTLAFEWPFGQCLLPSPSRVVRSHRPHNALFPPALPNLPSPHMIRSQKQQIPSPGMRMPASSQAPQLFRNGFRNGYLNFPFLLTPSFPVFVAHERAFIRVCLFVLLPSPHHFPHATLPSPSLLRSFPPNLP